MICVRSKHLNQQQKLKRTFWVITFTFICKFISLTWKIWWWTEKVISAQGRRSQNIKHDLNHLNIFIFKIMKFIGYKYFWILPFHLFFRQKNVDFQQKIFVLNVKNSNCLQSMMYFSFISSQHRYRHIVVYSNLVYLVIVRKQFF